MAKHHCQLNFLSRSDGSAFYSLGNTAVLVSVYGPSDVRAFNKLHDRLFLEVSYSNRTGNSNIIEKNVENTISQTVKQILMSHLHPGTSVTLTIQELQLSAMSFSASINGCCLALLDAGIQMKTVFAAVTCYVTEHNVFIIEPDEAEIMDGCIITFVFEGTNLSVLSTYQEGSISATQFSKCLKKCQEAAKDIFAFYRKTIEEKYDNFYKHSNNVK